MREPSIHITESTLEAILYECFLGKEFANGKEVAKANAKYILEKAKSFSCASRSVSVTNNKLEKRVEKLQLASRSDTGTFAQMLLLTRRKLKHRGLQLIKPGEPDWFNLKETCKLATDFCNEFGLPLKRGYQEYINIGMGMMRSFSIFKFKSLHAGICNRYEALTAIAQDPTPNATEETHDIYLAIIGDKVGQVMGYKEFPEKYQYFIQAKNEAKKYGVTPKAYIKAQFFGFEWKSSVPDPMQLVGMKAIERLQRWAFENQVRLGGKKTKVDFKKIKHG